MNKRRWFLYLLIFAIGIGAGVAFSWAVKRGGMESAPVCISGEAQGAAGTERLGAAVGTEDLAERIRKVNSAAKGETVEELQEAQPAAAQIADSMVPYSAGAPAKTYQEWAKDATYLGGNYAVYNGRLYRAKWWTLGETPDQADVWEDMGEAPGPGGEESGQPEDAGPLQPTQMAGETKVVGYYPDWKGYQPSKLQFDILTHVVYAFAIPTAEGGIRPIDNPEVARRLIEDAHKNQVKVLLAVGGWSYNGSELEPVFMQATSSSEKTKQFADAILSVCDQYGFDGVDIDWEHPRVDGSSKEQYQELMLYLAERLHSKGKVLTSAVLGGVSPEGTVYYDVAAHSDQVLAAVDWIHVMAYDGGDGERHSSYDFAVNCANYWSQTRGLPRNKVVLGLPFYGRPGWSAYGDILALDAGAGEKDHALVNGIDAYYNGLATVEKKTAYAREHLGGVMIWELTQDTDIKEKSLLSAIGRALR